MFGWFSSSPLRSEAQRLAERFADEFPPPGRSGAQRVNEKSVSRSLDRLYAEAADVSRKLRLGVIGRARLAKALQEELHSRGYPAELVGRVTNAVTVNALVASPGKSNESPQA
jgi:hypothetical protein